MNIRSEGMFPLVLPEGLGYPSVSGLKKLFDLRVKTYQGFAQIEKDKGLLRPKMSLMTSVGQEAARILVQRGLEELAEAYEAQSRDHYLEELIDSVNYFWALAIIDPDAPLGAIINIMIDGLMSHVHEGNTTIRITPNDIGQHVLNLNSVFEKLRHRAWMNSVHSQYFDGWLEIAEFLSYNLCVILEPFKDWSEFVQFFIAKDNILQFRLKTNY